MFGVIILVLYFLVFVFKYLLFLKKILLTVWRIFHENPIVFERCQLLSALEKSVIKAIFSTHALSVFCKASGILETNLESSPRDPLVSVLGDVETSWRHRQDFSPKLELLYKLSKGRATFDLSKQSSVTAVDVKKHLTEFLGLKELALKFFMTDFDLKLL